jgi:xylan 1,4-beta-xylosidase
MKSTMLQFTCDTAKKSQPLPHFWEHTIGSGHAKLALRSDWQAQLRRCREELGVQYIRFHSLLSDEMSTLVQQKDEPIYSFFNIGQVMDFLLSIGMKPLVELSFMPTALASGKKTVFHYKANVTPPKDYAQWATLIHKLLTHWVERYGLEELLQWYFEVWNEPNLESFWPSTQEDYFELYRRTAQTIKSVDQSLRVGGPATARNAWIEEFLTFCKQNKLPLDFISTHHYPTDVVEPQLPDAEAMLAKVPRSVLRKQAQDVQRLAKGYPVFYTEWNTSSSGMDALHDQAYAAAYIIKTIMEVNGLVEVYSFWTFTDIFEESSFPSKPFHGGFGLLNLHGIPKPSYRAFELLHHLGDELLPVDGEHETLDCWVVRGDGKISVVVTNTALPHHPIQTESIEIHLQALKQPQNAYLERIDETHVNPHQRWLDMGEPEYLTAEQIEHLHEASQLERESCPFRYENKTVIIDLTIPPQALAFITLELGQGKSS